HSWRRARRVALIVIRRPADPRKLHKQHARRDLAHPGSLGTICRAEPEIAERGIVGVTLEMHPIRLWRGKSRSCLQQQHVEATRRQLLGDHCAPTTCSDTDDVAHLTPPI